MNTIKLTEQQFLNFSPIKIGKVHSHNSLVYKLSPYSKNKMLFFDGLKKEKIYKQLATANNFLINESGKYWGFTMQFYHQTLDIISAINSGKVSKKEIAIEIINAIAQMDTSGFSYYDINSNNIKIIGRRPIFFDLDECIINPNIKSYIIERKNLINLILEIYLESPIGFSNLKDMWKNGNFNIFSQELQRYLQLAITEADYSDEYPYQLVEELENQHKLILK